ncbi:MAG: hypothetical protein E6Q43_01225 [Dokdonella sp.]|jgi:hypothetical protein|nr:MAG: hypothetical protein E6Q43_01225 [Dokdonella sp.]
MNIRLDFPVDAASAAKVSRHECSDATLDARLEAAFRKLVPPEPVPPDPIRQALLLGDDGFITEKQLADRLQVSLSLVQHWRSGGSGPSYFKFGSARKAPIRYLWPEILAWLREVYWIRPARPKLPHQISYRAGQQALWEFAQPSEPPPIDAVVE